MSRTDEEMVREMVIKGPKRVAEWEADLLNPNGVPPLVQLAFRYEQVLTEMRTHARPKGAMPALVTWVKDLDQARDEFLSDERPRQAWIPVEERLPEPRPLQEARAVQGLGLEGVLAWDGETYAVLILTDEGWYCPEADDLWGRTVTHWMALPKAPR